MTRHPNAKGIPEIKKFKRRERRVRAHQRFLAEMKATETAIESRRCPNDGGPLCKDGHCRRCDFRLTVLPPMPYSHRVPFNRLLRTARLSPLLRAGAPRHE